MAVPESDGLANTTRATVPEIRQHAQETRAIADDLERLAQVVAGAASAAAAVNFLTISPAALSTCAQLAGCVARNVSELRRLAEAADTSADLMEERQARGTDLLSTVETRRAAG
jgi:hypothetical protein